MSKLKRHKWQYEKKPKEQPKRVAPGLAYAMEMAKYQSDEEKRIRQLCAVDKEVERIQRGYSEDVAYWFYALMALALHDEGWGAKRILRVQERIRDYHREYNDPNFGPMDLWSLVRNEVGLDFDPGEIAYKRWKEREKILEDVKIHG